MSHGNVVLSPKCVGQRVVLTTLQPGPKLYCDVVLPLPVAKAWSKITVAAVGEDETLVKLHAAMKEALSSLWKDYEAEVRQKLKDKVDQLEEKLSEAAKEMYGNKTGKPWTGLSQDLPLKEIPEVSDRTLSGGSKFSISICRT